MADRNNDTELIVHLIKEQDEKRSIQIKGLHKNMEAGFEVFNQKLEHLDDKIEAIGRIDQHQEEEIKKLKKETSVWRWMQGNPKKTFLIIGLLFTGLVGILGIFTREEVEMLIKKIIGL